MKLTRVLFDDWEGFYKDGQLVIESHSVDARQLLEALGFEVESRELTEMEDSTLPQSLSELK
jgi:hypothetical protein